MTSSTFYDETVFSTGVAYRPYKTVNVFNNADAYLVQKLGLNTNRVYSKPIESDQQQSVAVNLNPHSLCFGINLFSMNWSNKRVKELVRFNPITVVSSSVANNPNAKTVPVFIGEHIPGTVYTVNETLCPFQSAIMIKYFAVNNKGVHVTERLHAYIRKYFAEQRTWFLDSNAHTIRQNHHHELIQNNKIINIPPVDLYGPEITL